MGWLDTARWPELTARLFGLRLDDDLKHSLMMVDMHNGAKLADPRPWGVGSHGQAWSWPGELASGRASGRGGRVSAQPSGWLGLVRTLCLVVPGCENDIAAAAAGSGLRTFCMRFFDGELVPVSTLGGSKSTLSTSPGGKIASDSLSDKDRDKDERLSESQLWPGWTNAVGLAALSSASTLLAADFPGGVLNRSVLLPLEKGGLVSARAATVPVLVGFRLPWCSFSLQVTPATPSAHCLLILPEPI